MIGDLRTDALHEALSRAPIEDDTLLALLVLAFAGQNVSIASGNAGGALRRHAARCSMPRASSPSTPTRCASRARR